jgi:spermidine synthase
MRVSYLYLVVFVGGMATLAIELTASRLLGNVFGTSNIVWANVIGLILLYLTVGYFIGGRWADRSPYRTTLYRIITWGAFLSAIIPIIASPVVRTAATAFSQLDAALALGSFVSILVLFAVPITLLGTISPFVIRLSFQSVEQSGQVSGQVYAISTCGSIIGTFLPVLYTIPELGTRATFLLFAGLLYAVAWVGLWREIKAKALPTLWMVAVVLALHVFISEGVLRPPYGANSLLYADDSPYNYIQVQEAPDGNRYLYLNEGQGIHSQWHPTQIFYNRTWDFFLTAPYFNDNFRPQDMNRLLIVGLATGTIARQHLAIYPQLPIDGIEIDPDIIKVGEQFFEMNKEQMPTLNAITADGRYGLSRLERVYTVIGIDAYRPPYIPWHLTTVQFFQEVKAKLEPENGVLVINVGRTNRDRRLVDALTNTLLNVFASVHAIDVPRSFNTILVATQRPTAKENLARNTQSLQDAPQPLLDVLNTAIASQVDIARNDILFTDDRAPLETLVDSLVLNFLLSDDTELLR